jgi:hypothetical protein
MRCINGPQDVKRELDVFILVQGTEALARAYERQKVWQDQRERTGNWQILRSSEIRAASPAHRLESARLLRSVSAEEAQPCQVCNARLRNTEHHNCSPGESSGKPSSSEAPYTKTEHARTHDHSKGFCVDAVNCE